MLTDKQQKNILEIVRKYRFARVHLLKTSYRRFYYLRKVNSLLSKAESLMDFLHDNIDKISQEDIKYYALLIANFEQFHRDGLLKKLQEHANFDVFYFVDSYHRGLSSFSSYIKPVKSTMKEMSSKQMDKMKEKYKKVCDDANKGKVTVNGGKILEKYRSLAYNYARGIVNGFITVSPENLQSAYSFLRFVCWPYVKGDVADQAKHLLKTQIAQQKRSEQQAEYEQKKQEKAEIMVQKQIEQFVSEQQNVVDDVVTEEQKIEQSETRKIYVLKTINGFLNKAINRVKENRVKIKPKIQEKKKEIEDAFLNIKSNIEKKRAEHQERKVVKEQERAKENTEKRELSINRVVLVRAAASFAAVLVLVGSCFALMSDTYTSNKQEKDVDVKPVKKEIKIQPVAEKPDTTVNTVQKIVTFDTAYMHALNNYYNFAMDIIAGTNKKADVLNKIENQIKSGNLALPDTISAQRVAYTYFIYREYGYKNIEVLNLAVNGNQKLTDAQCAELIKVINDAGERGTGVQKMAKQKVESRGRHLSTHSKFEHATKQQQLQHLVNIGLVKKAHVR